MRPQSILTGILGLALALVWTMSFLYQRDNAGFLIGMASAAEAPVVLRMAYLWSVLQIWIPALLALPVAVVSVGAMLGVKSMRRALRIAVAVGAVLSAGVLLLSVAFAIPRVMAGEPMFLPNPRISAEILAALVTLGIQLVLLALYRRMDGDSGDVAINGAAHNHRDVADAPPRSTRQSELVALPAPPAAARS